MNERFRGWRSWLDDDEEVFFMQMWRGEESAKESRPERPPENHDIDEGEWAAIALA